MFNFFNTCLCVWAPVLLWPQLQTGQPENPLLLLCKWFSRLPGPPALSSDWLKHYTQTVGHSPRAKGKHGWKVQGRPVLLRQISPGEVSAGHSRGALVNHPQSAFCLWRFFFLLSTETYVIPLATWCRNIIFNIKLIQTRGLVHLSLWKWQLQTDDTRWWHPAPFLSQCSCDGAVCGTSWLGL